MLLLREPRVFSPRFEVVSVFFEHKGKILLLHRHAHKSQGDRWGVPTGKREPGETTLQAMVREIHEETGVKVAATTLSFFRTAYVTHGDYDFTFHMFHLQLPSLPVVLLALDEHQDYQWVLPRDALSLNLVEDLDACIKIFYKLG